MIDVYLDVDGVILPVYDPLIGVLEEADGWLDWTGYLRPAWGQGAYSPSLIARLTALSERPDVTIHWCTTWSEAADLELAPRVGLPRGWNVLDRDHRLRRSEASQAAGSAGSWWKHAAVQEHHAANPDHAFVWIDDDLGFDATARTWLIDLRRRGESVLGITPSTSTGLTRREMDRIEAFVDEPGLRRR